ncbi:MAG TPA: hypothetical protein VGI54_01275 [Solirubrobacteraceae bacterium]
MRLPVGIALPLCLMALAGCGDSGKKDLARRANAICRAAQQRIDAVTSPATVISQDQAPRFFRRLRAIADPALDRLRALEPPAGLRDEWSAFIAAQQRYVKLIDALPREAELASPHLESDLHRSDRLFQATNTAADAVGAKECGKE